RYVFEVLQPLLPGALICPWLPQRLYLRASCPSEILGAISPSHRALVQDIILVPPVEAARIFAMKPTLPCRCWVRIKRGKYKNDLGYVLSCEGDMVSVLVAPQERLYDTLGGTPNNRALFDWHTAHDAGLELIPIANSWDITAFQYKDTSYFVGLLRLLLMTEGLERVPMPHPDQILLHAQAGIDPSLVEESYLLFSALFWIEGDVVRSSSPKLLHQRATVAAVDLDKRSVTLISDDREYACSLLEQCRVFSLGDQLRITAGPNHGYVGMVVSVLENELILWSSADLSLKVSINFSTLSYD
ncbi:hypothetical protein EV363DRAFT_1165509, partial [Boletus edulis]